MATAMQRPAAGMQRVLLVGVLGILLGAIIGGVVGRALSEVTAVPAHVETAQVDTAPEGVQIEAIRAANHQFEAPVSRLEIEAVRALNDFSALVPTMDIEAVRVLNDARNTRGPTLDIEAVRAVNFAGS
jgi:hypothetical protein